MENIVAGRNPVREALQARRPLNKVLISNKVNHKVAGEITALAREAGIPVQTVTPQRLDKVCGGTRHQGVIALGASKEYVEVEDLLAGDKHGNAPFLVVLNEINDPQNLGAILRSAEAAGVDGVILPGRRSAGLTAAVSKASAGAMEYVPVARVTNVARTLDYLKDQGLWVVGAHGEGEDIYWDVDLKGPLAVLIGGEDKGLGRLVREKCDFLVRFPMSGRVKSLNASVAAALVFYEVMRQRRGKNE